jgi:hypothetical protein
MMPTFIQDENQVKGFKCRVDMHRIASNAGSKIKQIVSKARVQKQRETTTSKLHNDKVEPNHSQIKWLEMHEVKQKKLHA